jgi:hypothetical protein
MKKFFVEFSSHLSRKFVQPFLACNLYIRRCADPRCEVNGSVFAKYCELADRCYVLTVWSQKGIKGFFFRPRVNGGAVHFFNCHSVQADQVRNEVLQRVKEERNILQTITRR